MSTRAKWSFVWAGWITYFGVAEYLAIRSASNDAPLTAHMRYILGAKSRPLHRRAGQIAFVSGAIWLVDHLYRIEENQ